MLLLSAVGILAACAFCFWVFARATDFGETESVAAVRIAPKEGALLLALVCFYLLFCSKLAPKFLAALPQDKSLAIFSYSVATQFLMFALVWVFRLAAGYKFDFRADFKTARAAVACFLKATATAFAISFALGALYLMAFKEPPPQQDVVVYFSAAKSDFARAAGLASIVVFAPIVEELFFRCTLYRVLKGVMGDSRRARIFSAAAVVAVLFAAAHSSAFAFVPLFALSLFFTALYERTGSIFAPVLCHGLFNLFNISMVLIAGVRC